MRGGNATQFVHEQTPLPSRIRFADGTVHDFEFDGEALAAWKLNGKPHARFDSDADAGILKTDFADGGSLVLKVQNGRLVEAKNDTCSLQRTYDDNGRLVKEQVDDTTVEFQYDKTGLPSAIVCSTGSSLNVLRDSEGRVRSVVDSAGREYRMTYQAHGPLQRVAYPNGVVAEFKSDEAGRDVSLEIVSSSGTRHFEAQYEYDECDRIVKTHEGTARRDFEYDAEGRLIRDKRAKAAESQSFTLDPMGNCLQAGENIFEVNELNQVVRFNGSPLTYDPRGNATKVPLKSGPATLVHDGAGNLVRAELKDGTIVEYAYDPLGRRIRKTIGARVTRYVWAGPQLLYEEQIEDEKKVEVRDYVFIPGTHIPLGYSINTQPYFQHFDVRCATVCITDRSGAPVWQATYAALGLAAVQRSEIRNPWRLLNQYFDEETGLHYNLARYYHPELGRYLSRDPLYQEGGSLNFYLYCGGDPLNKVDPTGELPFLLVAVLVGAVVGAVVAAGVQAYQQRNEPGSFEDKAWAVAKAAGKGALGGAVGGLVAGLAVMGAAALGSATAATMIAGGSLSSAPIGAILGVGALEGAAGALGQTCSDAVVDGEAPSAGTVIVTTLIGAALGALTLGALSKIPKRAPKPPPRQKTDLSQGGEFDGPFDLPNSSKDPLPPPPKVTNAGLAEVASGAGSKSRAELIADLESAGLKVKGSSPDGRFMEFVDADGNVRAKIHPPDKVTKTDHLHIQDEAGQSLDAAGNVVKPDSPDAHVPIQPK